MTRRKTTSRARGADPHAGPLARTIVLSLVTPLLEKNVLKTLSYDLPVVFSMSRVIVLAFAVAMIRQMWRAGIAGWPDATLAIAVVLALPIVGALDRATPHDVLSIARSLFGRFGVGDVRSVGSVYATEPSKFDDHRAD